MVGSFILAFFVDLGTWKISGGEPPSGLKWGDFEGLSYACLSVIVTQIIQIHNYSNLIEQPFMFSGSQWVVVIFSSSSFFFLKTNKQKKLFIPTPSLKGLGTLGNRNKDDRIYILPCLTFKSSLNLGGGKIRK